MPDPSICVNVNCPDNYMTYTNKYAGGVRFREGQNIISVSVYCEYDPNMFKGIFERTTKTYVYVDEVDWFL